MSRLLYLSQRSQSILTFLVIQEWRAEIAIYAARHILLKLGLITAALDKLLDRRDQCFQTVQFNIVNLQCRNRGRESNGRLGKDKHRPRLAQSETQLE